MLLLHAIIGGHSAVYEYWERHTRYCDTGNYVGNACGEWGGGDVSTQSGGYVPEVKR